ncbi:hypothetical protein EVAR_59094_1 [Eumeta japonica]|uniref:Uncharacterized protein n=1 Tax=Eumeta variegata TaxID=151549 RepID=A0A4C1Z0N3_EUMVA|nr:hypothetical protein EVAR_59094_1 [Eumeta japonica]
MYAEREQFEKQYYTLVSAAQALLDDHAPQHRRSRRVDIKSVTGSREVEPEALRSSASLVGFGSSQLTHTVDCCFVLMS